MMMTHTLLLYRTLLILVCIKRIRYFKDFTKYNFGKYVLICIHPATTTLTYTPAHSHTISESHTHTHTRTHITGEHLRTLPARPRYTQLRFGTVHTASVRYGTHTIS